MFPCDWCLSIHFVSFCVSTFAVCARAVSGNDRLVSSKLYMIFLIFISCKNNAISASCPQQKFHSSSRFPSLFLSSLGSLSISFLRAKLGECVALWLALTPPPTQMIDGTEKPVQSLQTRNAIQQIWLQVNSQRWESRPFEQTWRLWQFTC